MLKRSIGFLFLSLTLLVGCQQEETQDVDENAQGIDDYFLQIDQPKQDLPNKTFESNEDIADHLAEVASSVPSINGANALVAGPYAIVAIDVDRDLNRSRVGTIKYAVSEALYHDPYGKTAVVITDPDIAARIEGMSEKMAQGYPIHGIVDQLAAIVGRVMPEFPTNEHQPIEPDQNKEILNENEREQLENIQTEHQ